MKKYTNFNVEQALKTMTILYDTREQPTKRLSQRLEDMKCSTERRKLDYGDYSCQCVMNDNNIIDLSSKVVVERKMNLDELCLCFGKERERFEREFERAKEAGCKIYLLVEDTSWEEIYYGQYRSKLSPLALIASLAAWMPRYDMIPIFCKSETTGKLIKEILYRELKEYLINLEEENHDSRGNQVGLYNV